MASLKEIRTRISSVTSTRQITSAMKMVSAAKLRKAQDKIIQMRPFASKLEQMLYDISDNLKLIENNEYIQQREIKRVALVVISSNKGLCGAFNANIIKRTIQQIEEKYSVLNKDQLVDIINIGKKGNEFFKNKNYNVTEVHDSIFDNLTYEEVVPIIKELTKKYLNGYYDTIELVYNRFRNAAIQEIMADQLLPLKPLKKDENTRDNNSFYYIYEPSEKEIIIQLIPKVIRINFYRALLDSFASEHGARMTAMHKATDNATEMIKDLTLQYNKARQASITKEILEIVGGAEALKG